MFEYTEQQIEKYYRSIVADDIDKCLYQSRSEDNEELRQVYWFNQGLMYASMIARFGLTENVTDNE